MEIVKSPGSFGGVTVCTLGASLDVMVELPAVDTEGVVSAFSDVVVLAALLVLVAATGVVLVVTDDVALVVTVATVNAEGNG